LSPIITHPILDGRLNRKSLVIVPDPFFPHPNIKEKKAVWLCETKVSQVASPLNSSLQNSLFLVNTNQQPINNPQKLGISRTRMVQDVHQTLFPRPNIKEKSGLAMPD